MPSPVQRITTHRALVSAGWDEAAIRRELRSGRLVAMRRGVYAPASLLAQGRRNPQLAYTIEAASAVLAQHRSVVVSHRSAALLHGLDVLERPNDVELTSPVPCQRVGRSVPISVASLPTSHCDDVRGVPVTSVGRTVIDVARTCPIRDALVVADCALHRALTSSEQLFALVKWCTRWPGVNRARAVLDMADRRAESALETLGRLLMHEHGLPPPELQVPIEDAGGVFAYADLGWPQARVVVEFDGMLKYDGADPYALRREKLRQERIEKAGWIVVRLTWRDVVHDAQRSIARVRDALARAARLRS